MTAVDTSSAVFKDTIVAYRSARNAKSQLFFRLIHKVIINFDKWPAITDEAQLWWHRR